MPNQHPDEPTTGTPVSYSHHLGISTAYHVTSPDCRGAGCEPGTWYPEALDSARSRVIEAARAFRTAVGIDELHRTMVELDRALDALTQEAPDAT